MGLWGNIQITGDLYILERLDFLERQSYHIVHNRGNVSMAAVISPGWRWMHGRAPPVIYCLIRDIYDYGIIAITYIYVFVCLLLCVHLILTSLMPERKTSHSEATYIMCNWTGTPLLYQVMLNGRKWPSFTNICFTVVYYILQLFLRWAPLRVKVTTTVYKYNIS